MPSRNVNIIILAACLSVLCYFVQRRAKTAMLVGDALEMIDTYYVDRWVYRRYRAKSAASSKAAS